MKLNFSISLLLTLFMMCSCHKQEEDFIPDPGYEYFPVIAGQWIVYQVDTVFVRGLITDTSHWEVKDVSTGAAVVNEKGERISGVQRYIRKSGSVDWTGAIQQTGIISTSSHVMVNEGNQYFVSLVFPVKEGTIWDGNAYNGFESQEYKMRDVGQGFTVDGQFFQESLKVVEMEHTTLISQDISEKVYSKGIGMIYARMVHLINLQSIQNKSGFIAEYRIINSGN